MTRWELCREVHLCTLNWCLRFQLEELGAQAIGRGNVDKRVDVIAAMVSMNGTIRDLKNLELCYSPVFGTARDVVNQAALVAENILYGRFRQVPVTQVRSLVEEQAFIVDVREKGEYEVGHLKGSVNIPLSELRERTDEIRKTVRYTCIVVPAREATMR